MSLPKDYFIQAMREKHPHLDDAPDEFLYLYGRSQNPNIDVEHWEGVSVVDPQKEEELNITPWYFDYLDYGTDEDSWGWRKAAYNNSLTGMTEQLLTGNPRFNLSDYEENKTLVDDIVSTAMGFFMPLDLASLYAGGTLIAKGSNMVAPFALKQMGKRATAKVAALEGLEKAAPRATAMLTSGGSLGAYEGAVGYVSAKNSGMSTGDALKEAGKGVLHGGMIGAMVGGIGAGFGAKHAELALAAEKGTLTTAQKLAKLGTGKIGTYGAEVGAFQGVSTIEHLVATGELPSADDFLRELTFNAGLIGALKLSHLPMQKANEYIKKNKGKRNFTDSDLDLDSLERLNKNIQDDTSIPIDQKEQISSIISEAHNTKKKAANDTAIGFAGITYFIDKVLPKILKSKRADEGTANTLKDVIIGVHAQKEALEKLRRDFQTDRSNENITDAEAKALDRIIEESKGLETELEQVLVELNTNAETNVVKSQRTIPHSRKKIIELSSEHGIETGDLFTDPNTASKDKWTKKERLEASQKLDTYIQEEVTFAPRKQKVEDVEVTDVDKVEPLSTEAFRDTIKDIEGIDKFSTEKKDRILLAAEQDAKISKDKGGLSNKPEQLSLYEQSKKIIRSILQGAYISKIGKTVRAKSFVEGTPERINDLNALAKHLAKEGKSFKDITNADIESYLAQKPHTVTAIQDLIKILKDRKLLDLNKFTLSKDEISDLGKTGRFIGESPQGVRTDNQSYNISQKNSLTFIQPKTNQSITKFITEKTRGLLKSLRKAVKGDFLFTDTKGKVLSHDILNKFVSKIFGTKGTKDKARLFRKSLETFTAEKFGEADAIAVMRWVLGETTATIGDTRLTKLNKAYNKEATQRDVAKKAIKAFIKDINSKNPSTLKSKEVFSPKDIAEGLSKIKNDIKVDGVTIPKQTAEALINYMLETSPRLNEITPSAKQLAKIAKIEALKEKHGIEYQFEAGEGDPITQTFLNEMSKRNPGLGKIIHKFINKNVGNQNWAGRFVNGAIELAKGKSTVHTFFHENGERLKIFLKEIGDTSSLKEIEKAEKSFASWAKKNDSKRWNEYYIKNYKTESKAAKEYFMDRMADIATKRQTQKGLVNRLTQHGNLIFSKIKNFLGLGTKEDIARIYGEKVFKGFTTEGAKLKGVEFKQTERAKKSKIQLRKDIQNVVKKLGLPDQVIRIAAEKVGIDIKEGKDINLSKITNEDQLGGMFNIISMISPKGKKLRYRNKSHISMIMDVLDINRKKGVNDKVFSDMLEALGVKNGELNNASKDALKDYFSIVKESLLDTPTKTSVIDVAIAAENKQDAFIAVPLAKRAMMPVTVVLRKYGGKIGNSIAKLIEEHNFLEYNYHGRGDRIMREVRYLYKNNRDYISDVNRYWLIDEQRQANMLKNWSSELSGKDKAFLKALEDPNSIQSKGVKKFNDLMDFYWKSIEKEAKRWNNPAELDALKKRLKAKFVKSYFTRRVTKKALKIINSNPEYIEKAAKKDLQRAAINKAVEVLEKQGIDTKIAKDRVAKEANKYLSDEAFVKKFYRDILASMQHGYIEVKNPHMLDRTFYLGEFIKDADGKNVRSYETNFSNTGDRYIRKMSKFLSSIRYFPDYTSVGGKHTVPRAKGGIGEALARNNKLGEYIRTSVERVIGIREKTIEDGIINVLEVSGRFSAVAGLSSPFSGIKNLYLGVAHIYGNTNLRSTLYGLSKMLNRDAELHVRELGGLSEGHKYMELTGWSEKLFRFNLMEQTEGWNRIGSVYAKKMYNESLINTLKGNKEAFFAKRNRKLANSELLRVINQTQIDFLKSYEAATANKAAKNMYHDIHIRLDQQAHKKLQGGTGVGEMPLWYSGRAMKPFTLFQRMAYAATWNSTVNYLQPIKQYGNFMPLIRFGAASYLSGASLYYMYDKILGVEPPKSQNTDKVFTNAMMNLWKAEFLGLFTEALNLYGGYSPNLIPIQTPVIVRHMQNAGKGVLKWYHGDKTWDEAAVDFTKQYAVVLNHAERFLEHSTQPYTSNTRRINTLKRVFMRENGWDSPISEKYGYNRLPFYTKFRADFSKGGKDMYKSYFSAYNYIVSDFLQESGNINPSRLHVEYAHKEASTILKGIVTKMNPNNLSKATAKKGRDISVSSQFELWLQPKNEQILEKLIKEYHYKTRQLTKQIGENYKRNSVFPYKVKY